MSDDLAWAQYKLARETSLNDATAGEALGLHYGGVDIAAKIDMIVKEEAAAIASSSLEDNMRARPRSYSDEISHVSSTSLTSLVLGADEDPPSDYSDQGGEVRSRGKRDDAVRC